MRVIAGRFRGRTIRAPRGNRTRPTTDRVREAWFSVLGDIEGNRVLELYAGSGALGIEALSRGAASLVAVEAWPTAAHCIESNLTQLGAEALATVITAPAERLRGRLNDLGPFDLVLADPPWTDMERAERTLARLLDDRLFGPSGRAMIGHPKGRTLVLGAENRLVCVDHRAWGDSGASLFEITRSHEAPSL